jgi:exodeoxyribonuclease VII large subunit
MAKTSKSQWDFGELFQPSALRRIWSVTELTLTVKRLLEDHVGQIWVTGEISNLRIQSSGHMYFTLKDANAQLSCVLFRGEPQVQRSLIQDGQKVVLQGAMTVYEPRGQYQLRVIAVELQGVGALQLAFERLKQKLNAEGLFAPERKRKMPPYAARIGIATSPTGAAIRDVVNIIRRRDPGVELILAPCRVQGSGAAEEIAEAIRLLNLWALSSDSTVGGVAESVSTAQPRLDVILVTRGGGSLEDLWAFNEECVARAIFKSAVPVVSAVGHEIDFTISDFVADVRAATPSAAAEIITEGRFSARPYVADASKRIGQLIHQRLLQFQDQVESRLQRLRQLHPRRRLERQMQRLDDLQVALNQILKSRYRENKLRLQVLHQRIMRIKPRQWVTDYQTHLQMLLDDLVQRAHYVLEKCQTHQSALAHQLEILSPRNVLSRGYSITRESLSGKVIRRAEDLAYGDKIDTQFHLGSVESVVTRFPTTD